MNFHNFNESLFNRTALWSAYSNSGTIDVKIQPYYRPNEYVIFNIESFIKKIETLSKKYYLVGSCCELYRKLLTNHGKTKLFKIRKDYTHHIKFRIADSLYDGEESTEYRTYPGEIPNDIKSQIVKDVILAFGKNSTSFDEFNDRGYILFDLMICR